MLETIKILNIHNMELIYSIKSVTRKYITTDYQWLPPLKMYNKFFYQAWLYILPDGRSLKYHIREFSMTETFTVKAYQPYSL